MRRAVLVGVLLAGLVRGPRNRDLPWPDAEWGAAPVMPEMPHHDPPGEDRRPLDDVRAEIPPERAAEIRPDRPCHGINPSRIASQQACVLFFTWSFWRAVFMWLRCIAS